MAWAECPRAGTRRPSRRAGWPWPVSRAGMRLMWWQARAARPAVSMRAAPPRGGDGQAEERVSEGSRDMHHRTVGELMTHNVVRAPREMPFKEIVELLAQNDVTAVPVVDGSGHPIGVVSE